MQVRLARRFFQERDKKESEDDKRIPEELKQLAEKYAKRTAEAEAKTDEDPMGDFFIALGKTGSK